MTSSPNDPQYVFTNQTTSGNSTTHYLTFTDNAIVVMAFGTWNGANITYQTLAPDGSTWINLFDLASNPFTSTANDQFVISDYVKGQGFRAVLANAGGSTNLTVTLQDI
jgi:hypothetical protein